jgi:hypothetical protein
MNALRIWNLHNHHLVAVNNYNHTCQLMSKEALKHLKVLSIAKIWLSVVSFQRPSLKGEVRKIFYQNPVHPSSYRIVI